MVADVLHRVLSAERQLSLVKVVHMMISWKLNWHNRQRSSNGSAWSLLGRLLVFAFLIGIVLARDIFGSFQRADKASSLIRSISSWKSLWCQLSERKQTSAKCTHCFFTKKSAPSAECSFYLALSWHTVFQSVLLTCCSFSHSCSILQQSVSLAESNWATQAANTSTWAACQLLSLQNIFNLGNDRLIATLYRFKMRCGWCIGGSFSLPATVAVMMMDRSSTRHSTKSYSFCN